MIAAREQSDSMLLREFASHRSQDAFSELVARHSDWVYSASARLVRDPHLAQDVAQAVFMVMAEKAGNIGSVPLHRWLFKVTRYAAANAIRARARRDKHERLAAMAHAEECATPPNQNWEQIAPVLDDSISRLKNADRDALLMRFYQQKSVGEVATALGVSEGAAKIRILRAIEKLRGILRRRGVSTPTDTLGAVLLANVTRAHPSFLMGLGISKSTSANALVLSKGTMKMMLSSKIKVGLATVLLCAIPLGAAGIYLAEADKPVAPANAPAGISAPAQPEATLDPRVAPFVNDSTDILLAIDFGRIDVDAIVNDMRMELAKDQLDPAAAARLGGMMQTADALGKRWISGFHQAGGSIMYLLSRSDELSLGEGPGPHTMKLSGTIVMPTGSAQAAQTLAQYMTSPGGSHPKVIGDTVVIESSAAEMPQGDEWSGQTHALAAGLAAVPDAPLRAAIKPEKLHQLLAKLMASGNINTQLPAQRWDNVEYASMDILLPPDAGSRFVTISHFKDAASAQKSRDEGTQYIDANFRDTHPTTSPSPLQAAMRKFVATETFTVSGTDVIASLDLHAYWHLLFAAINSAQTSAGGPATQRPH